MSSISILICTRNRSGHLAETLRSLSQVHVPPDWDVELIVIDNGSTDSTRTVVEEARLANMLVRYLQEPRTGQCFARNAGLALATGGIIVFTDDDVRVAVDWLERLCGPILSGEADATTGTIRVADHLRRTWLETALPALVASQEHVHDGPVQYVIGANMAMTRVAASAVNGFDPELGPGALGFGDDSLFSMQLSHSGKRLRGVSEAVVCHHFDETRLLFGELLLTARRMGQSEAYIHYHWRHGTLWGWQWLATVRRTIGLLRRRYRGGPGWSDRGIPPYWQLSLASAVGFVTQYRIERRRSRNYERFGLMKRQEGEPSQARSVKSASSNAAGT